MVDYSKWDKLDTSDDDDESAKPRVRRVDPQQLVSIGPDGVLIHHKCEKSCLGSRTRTENNESSAGRSDAGKSFDLDNVYGSFEGMDENDKPLIVNDLCFDDSEEWPRCGRAQPVLQCQENVKPLKFKPSVDLVEEDSIRNGGVCEGIYFWSQTKTEVKGHILIPDICRGRDILVDIKRNEFSCRVKRSCIIDGQISSVEYEANKNLIGSDKDYVTILSGNFPYSIVEDEDSWTWEIVKRNISWKKLCDFAKKYDQKSEIVDGANTSRVLSKNTSVWEGEVLLSFVEVNLKKHIEFSKSVVWWPSFLKGGPKVCTSLFEDRSVSKAKTFCETWDEAHKIFTENIRKQGADSKIEI